MTIHFSWPRGFSALVAAGLALASSTDLAAQSKRENPVSRLFAASVEGDTQINRDGKVEDLTLKTSYKAEGSVIETKPKATNAIVFSNGTGVYFASDTRMEVSKFLQEPFTPNRNDLEIEPSVSQTDATIARGIVGLCTTKLVAGTVMKYRTPFGSVSMQTGKFVVESDVGQARISVLEGEGLVRGGSLDLGGRIIHGGEQAVITPGAPGSPNVVTVQKIPDDQRSSLDDKVFAACAARKTVYFETTEKDPTNVVAIPVVPPTLPPPVTVSPSTLPR